MPELDLKQMAYGRGQMRRAAGERALGVILLMSVCTLCASVLSACGNTESEAVPASFLRIAIDKSEPKRLLRYYFGGYVSPEASDPFDAGLVHDRGGRLYVDLEALGRHAPAAARQLDDADANGRIDWEEFEAFIDQTYNEVRSVPKTLEDLEREAAFEAGDSAWISVDVNGVMTTARRRIFVRTEAVRQALKQYQTNRGELRYPVGTTFIGQHHLEGDLAETTVMRKREDGFWDFFVYGSSGELARGTSTPPRELKSPVECVGCHFGDKLFEPEKSFPVRARPGPHGPRDVHVGEALRDEEVVRRFDEHRRRSDTILGLYTTLFVSELRTQRREGSISASDAALLDSLQL